MRRRTKRRMREGKLTHDSFDSSTWMLSFFPKASSPSKENINGSAFGTGLLKSEMILFIRKKKMKWIKWLFWYYIIDFIFCKKKNYLLIPHSLTLSSSRFLLFHVNGNKFQSRVIDNPIWNKENNLSERTLPFWAIINLSREIIAIFVLQIQFASKWDYLWRVNVCNLISFPRSRQ